MRIARKVFATDMIVIVAVCSWCLLNTTPWKRMGGVQEKRHSFLTSTLRSVYQDETVDTNIENEWSSCDPLLCGFHWLFDPRITRLTRA
jgi:hypothetical protein